MQKSILQSIEGFNKRFKSWNKINCKLLAEAHKFTFPKLAQIEAATIMTLG